MSGSRRGVWGLVIAVVVVVAVVAGEVLLLIHTWGAPKDSPEREVMGASIQVLFVVLVGAVVTMAIGSIQRDSDERRKRAEDAKAEERRVDERVTDFAARLVEAYNGVKRVRRLLGAETGPLRSRDQPHRELAIRRDAYVQHMSDLCDRQLEFESLTKRAGVLQARIEGAEAIKVKEKTRKAYRTTRIRDLDSKGSGVWTTTQDSWKEQPRLSLEKVCGAVESNLNKLVEEYQENLHRMPDEATMRLDELQPPPAERGSSSAPDGDGPMLPVFIFDTDCFRALVTRYVDAARDCLDERLLRQAEEPGPSRWDAFFGWRTPRGQRAREGPPPTGAGG